MPSLQMMAKLLNNQTLEALKHPLDTPKRYLGCATASPKIRSPLGQASKNAKFEDFSFPASPQGSRSAPAQRPQQKPQTVASVEAAKKTALAGDAFCLNAPTATLGVIGQCSEGSPTRHAHAQEEQRLPEGGRKEDTSDVHRSAWEAYKLRTQRIADRALRPSAERPAQPAEPAQRGGPYPALLGQETKGDPQRPSEQSAEDSSSLHLSAHEAYMARVQRISNRRVPLRPGTSQQERAEAQPQPKLAPRAMLRPGSGGDAPRLARQGFPSLLGREGEEKEEAAEGGSDAVDAEEPQSRQQEAAAGVGTCSHTAFHARQERRAARRVVTSCV